MTGYQLTKAFYAEVEQNEAMQVGCKAHHHSLFTWICELRNRIGHEVLDLPVNYTMQMAFIGSQHTLAKAIDDLAQWGLIEVLLKSKGRNTKIKIAIAFLQKHCKSDANEDAAFAEMQLQKCKKSAIKVQTTKTNKTDKTKDIYIDPAFSEKKSTLVATTEELAVNADGLGDVPPVPAPLVPAAGLFPAPNPPEVIDTTVRANGNGQMIKPDLPTLTAFVLAKGGTAAMAENMFDFYSSKGWLVGKSPMKDWNATARKWIRENAASAPPGNRSGPAFGSPQPKPVTTAPRPTHQTKIR